MRKVGEDYTENKTYYDFRIKIFEAETKEELETIVNKYWNNFEFYWDNKLEDIKYSTAKLKRNKVLYSAMVIYRHYSCIGV